MPAKKKATRKTRRKRATKPLTVAQEIDAQLLAINRAWEEIGAIYVRESRRLIGGTTE